MLGGAIVTRIPFINTQEGSRRCKRKQLLNDIALRIGSKESRDIQLRACLVQSRWSRIHHEEVHDSDFGPRERKGKTRLSSPTIVATWISLLKNGVEAGWRTRGERRQLQSLLDRGRTYRAGNPNAAARRDDVRYHQANATSHSPRSITRPAGSLSTLPRPQAPDRRCPSRGGRRRRSDVRRGNPASVTRSHPCQQHRCRKGLP